MSAHLYKRFDYPYNLWNEIIGGDDDSSFQFLDKAGLEKVLCGLGEIPERVLKLRFGYDGKVRTQKAVGRELGKTSQQVGNILTRELLKLKHPAFRRSFDKRLEDNT